MNYGHTTSKDLLSFIYTMAEVPFYLPNKYIVQWNGGGKMEIILSFLQHFQLVPELIAHTIFCIFNRETWIGDKTNWHPPF